MAPPHLSLIQNATMEQLNIVPDVPVQIPRLDLMDLPSELHMLISSYLPYPDALALKHTCRHFHSLVYTGNQRPRLNLMDLPSELHILISSYLAYPDALALKHTCRHFRSFVYTGVHLKVDWLVERFERKLECPMEKCSFRTDESFCNWRIRRIMERRRRHLECRRVVGGCLVIEGRTCQTDLMPSWLKRQNPWKVAKTLSAWGREGGLLLCEIMLCLADRRACSLDCLCHCVLHGGPVESCSRQYCADSGSSWPATLIEGMMTPPKD